MAAAFSSWGVFMEATITTRLVGGLGGEDGVTDSFNIESALPTLEQLIELKVRQEVMQYNEARRNEYGLEYLTSEEVAKRLDKGTVKLKDKSPLDPGKEVERAKKAFEAGQFFVFANKRQVTKLDEEIDLSRGEPVVFLRILPIVGG